jgi:hypothetical protein
LRILDRFAERSRKSNLLLGCQALVAQKNDEVIEQRMPDLGDDLCAERLRSVYTLDLDPERTRDRTHFDVAVGAGKGLHIHAEAGVLADRLEP